MLSLHARRSHIQIFSIFNLLYMVCMEYALLQRIVTHDYIEKCLCGGNASWADKTSDLSVTTSPGSILYCDVLKKNLYLKCVFYFTISCGWDGRMGGVGRVCRATVRNPRSTLLAVDVSMPFLVAGVHTQELLPESAF